MGTVLYLVKESLRGLFSARLMTVVSVMTIAVALFCIGVATVVLLNVQRKLDETSLRMGMVAYCADGTADSSSRID
jgi:cell division protein FtsX